MHKIFNFIEDKAINLPLTENRGFLYGDGFFETIIVKNQQLSLFSKHYERMLYASQQLKFIDFPSENQLITRLKSFISTKHNYSRLKVIVFRNSDGLFAPNQNTPLFYFEEKEINQHAVLYKTAFFAKTVSNQESLTSRFKTLSSLNYVLAGVELNQSSFNEIILLDREKNISECLSSNIWWIKEGIIYTPSSETGCVNGVAKANITSFFNTMNIKVNKGKFSKDQLLNADFCFTSNVAGLHIIKSIENTNFQKDHLIFDEIKKIRY